MIAPLQHGDTRVARVARNHEGENLAAARGKQLVSAGKAFEQKEDVDWRLVLARDCHMGIQFHDAGKRQLDGPLFFGRQSCKYIEFSSDGVHHALLAHCSTSAGGYYRREVERPNWLENKLRLTR